MPSLDPPQTLFTAIQTDGFFICHSREKHRGTPKLFPKWNSDFILASFFGYSLPFFVSLRKASALFSIPCALFFQNHPGVPLCTSPTLPPVSPQTVYNRGEHFPEALP